MSSFMSSLIPLVLATLSLLPLFTVSTDSSLLDFTGHMVGVRSTKVPGEAEKIITPEYCKESVRIANGNLNVYVSSEKMVMKFTSPAKKIILENFGNKSYYLVSLSNITCEKYLSYDSISRIVRNSKGVLNVTYYDGSTQEYCHGFCSSLDDMLEYCDDLIDREVSFIMNISSDMCEY